jgi:hypothetical protein
MTTPPTVAASSDWPALPLAQWADSYATIHRWLQIIGKTRLRSAPPQNHWWHTALYLTTRGVGTSMMPHGSRGFDVELDFITHRLVVRTTDGTMRSIPLRAQPVADFFEGYMALLEALGVPVQIDGRPNELADATPFRADRLHASYDPDAANRCWRVLVQTHRVLARFRSAYVGKCSPVHLWWGGFDLAHTRFSGRRAPRHPGGIPNCPDYVAVEGYSHECMSVGWWPGTVGSIDEPAFYAYAYPEPAGCPTAPIAPQGAYYHATLREWILPYEVVRLAPDPDAALLAFCDSTYATAATLGDWPRAELERMA